MKLSKLMEQNADVRTLFRSVENCGMDRCSCEYLRPKEVLLRNQDCVDHICFLVHGEMWAFNEFINGRRYSTERIVAGSYIGEMEAVAAFPYYISTVTAVSLCLLVHIPLDVYMHWFSHYPAFSQAAAMRLAGSLCRNATTIGVNSMLTAGEAVSMLLCNLYRERQKNHGPVVITETRQGLAEHAGVSLRSVNRAIAQLTESGCISLRKGKVVITAKGHDLLLENISRTQDSD